VIKAISHMFTAAAYTSSDLLWYPPSLVMTLRMVFETAVINKIAAATEKANTFCTVKASSQSMQ